ncbi:MAG: PIN domain-containing protein [Cyclobacteriaceae bacterium]
MKGKVFVDTNILVYLFSETEHPKRDACQQAIDYFDERNQLVWSTQVIQEYYQTLTKKFGLDSILVKRSLDLYDSFELMTNTRETIDIAIDIQTVNRLSFCDSLILAAASQAKCSFLLSEDMNEGQKIGRVKIISPFNITL